MDQNLLSVTYQPLPPSPEVDAWLERHIENGATLMSTLELQELGAPQYVIDWWQEREAGLKAWEEAAKDRPQTWCPFSNRVRFFDGPWLSAYDVPVTACCVVEDENGERTAYQAAVQDTYQKLMDAGEIDKCRVIAAAIYEQRKLRDAGDRVLVMAVLGAEFK